LFLIKFSAAYHLRKGLAVGKPEIKVLDKGFLRLELTAGDDLLIVNAARMSFLQRSYELTEEEEGLIGFLMRNRHGTPFEMVEFWWHVKCPITVAREWFRHRIASYNEMSGRYRKLPKEFYVPAPENVRAQVGKPGAYRFEPMNLVKADGIIRLMEASYADSWDDYQMLLDLGVAKELARSVLPVGIYTEFMFKCNFRSLMNFISLRTADAAMYEIRCYANAMAKIVATVVPVAWRKFEENERICP
jgi:thymidylate synthase (FAD)